MNDTEGAATEAVPRSWAEKLFYAGLCAFSVIALHTELQEPHGPWFWVVWASLVLIMGYGFVQSLRRPLLRLEREQLVIWRSPYSAPMPVRYDAVKMAFVETGRRKLTIEIMRTDGDTLNFMPSFISGKRQDHIIALLRQRLSAGRVDVDPMKRMRRSLWK
ncbi:hypothetical protein J2T57_004072 [Natronocella acetinitrilica]|uniref:Uncharacterized protein n=1 Tax=Natronocella acetinitrilica TaxID=414046 RepID=A0AAE3G8C8_9GAMM|nr:hypothetical protein [Natronocella acetinitrilica]MCP1676898.1 hypothetical protein [Natronocella acetinitrilica]